MSFFQYLSCIRDSSESDKSISIEKSSSATSTCSAEPIKVKSENIQSSKSSNEELLSEKVETVGDKELSLNLMGEIRSKLILSTYYI